MTPWRLLQTHPSLQKLFAGALLSAVGDTLTWTALTWHVVETTNSGAAVGWLLLSFALPAVLTGAPLGRLLDRHSPRALMLADNIARAVLTALIPVFGMLGWLSLPMLYTLAALEGALAPVTRAGLRLLIPRLVEDDDLEAANAVMGWTENLPMIVGAPLAGVIIARWGALNALYLDAASFLALCLMLISIPTPAAPPPAEGKTSGGPPLLLLRYPSVAILTAMSASFFFAYGPTEAALPLFVKNALRSDARGLGIVWGAVGAGAALGSLFIGPLGKLAKTGSALAGIALFWGIFQGAFVVSKTVWQGALWFFFGGIAWGPYLALEATFLQRTVPKEEHGAIFGAHAAALAPMVPLGTALGGLLLVRWTPRHVLLGSAMASVLAALLGFLLLRLFSGSASRFSRARRSN